MTVAHLEPIAETTFLKTKIRCAHSRIIDDVRTTEGEPSGKVICLECLTIYPDPIHGSIES